MKNVLLNGEIVPDSWSSVADTDPVPAQGDVLVSLARWSNEKAVLSQRNGGRLGLQLSTSDEPQDVASHLEGVDLVAVHIPVFTDGRGYSLARLLRTRYGWNGELRAKGDVAPDQVCYMKRVGFSSFELPDDKQLEIAHRLLSTDFTVKYQASADTGPLYRNRSA